jgi:hypothetical protein
MPDMIVGRERRKAEKENGLEAAKSMHGDAVMFEKLGDGSGTALAALLVYKQGHTRCGEGAWIRWKLVDDGPS